MDVANRGATPLLHGEGRDPGGKGGSAPQSLVPLLDDGEHARGLLDDARASSPPAAPALHAPTRPRVAMAVPYIGARISLTSRSLIRYEGILANVDPREATISLERVAMMGTEGRRPGQDIEASPEVYDLVVFRSADIEDLQLFDPAPPPPPKPFVDPAIVSQRIAAPARANAPPAAESTRQQREPQQAASDASWPAAPRLQFGSVVETKEAAPSPPSRHYGTASSQQQHHAIDYRTTQHAAGAAPPAEPASRPAFGSLASNGTAGAWGKPAQPPQRTAPGAQGPPSGHSDQAPRPPRSVTIDVGTPGYEAPPPAPAKVLAYNTAASKGGSAAAGQPPLVEQKTRSYASVLNESQAVRAPPAAAVGGYSGAAAAPRPAPSSRPVPRTDYDFVQATQRMEKQKSELAAREDAAVTCYDKTSSFFDTISCDANEKEAAGSYASDRRRNIETFGVAESDPSKQRSAANAARGRGGHRGGRGGQYSANGAASSSSYRGGPPSGSSAEYKGAAAKASAH